MIKVAKRFLIFVVVVCAAALAAAQTAVSRVPSASATLQEAKRSAERGDGAKALELTKAVLAARPGFVPALKFQGLLLEDMGRSSEAEESYEQALKLAPNDGEMLLRVGVHDLVAGRNDRAIERFQQRLKQLPSDGDTYFYLAQAQHLEGDNALALKSIRRALKLEPENVPVWQKYGELLCSSGDNETALHWLTKARQADPSLERIDFDLAVANYQNRSLDQALQYAKKAVALRPGDRKALALLGAVEVKLAQWQEADAVYQRILAGAPGDASALLELGHCELALKQYQASADVLEQLLKIEPTLVLAHFYLSQDYASLGRTADAEHEAQLHSKLMEQSVSRAPETGRETEETTVRQARALLTDGRETEALKLFRELAKGPSATAGAPYLLVGVTYLQMGRPADAERLLNQSLAVEPTVHGAHTYLGILALQQADLDNAEREFRQELEGDPHSPLALAELGEVAWHRQHWAEAADQIARSKLANPFFLYMLCDAYFHLGDVKDALLTAELIVDYNKKDQEVRQQVIALLKRNGQPDAAQRLSSE